MTMDAYMRGELARRCGVNGETLRYYERRGLVPKPRRSASNYRLYPEETVARVRFVKRAQELGCTLEEIKELLSLRASSDAKCVDVRARAETKIQDVDEKIRSLRAMRKALAKLVDECSGKGPVSNCPILDSLGSRPD